MIWITKCSQKHHYNGLHLQNLKYQGMSCTSKKYNSSTWIYILSLKATFLSKIYAPITVSQAKVCSSRRTITLVNYLFGDCLTCSFSEEPLRSIWDNFQIQFFLNIFGVPTKRIKISYSKGLNLVSELGIFVWVFSGVFLGSKTLNNKTI